MLGAYAAMPVEEQYELHRWESENLGDSASGTSNWPGWLKYIGIPPWHQRDPKPTTYKKKPIPKSLRKKVFERDAYRCVSCGSWNDLTVDHILAESKGGEATLENLQAMCRSCNCRKGAR